MKKRTGLRLYAANLFVGIDQLLNAILFGDPDETISSRLGKWTHNNTDNWKGKVALFICKILHFIDPNHCDNSIEEDEGDRDLLNRKRK